MNDRAQRATRLVVVGAIVAGGYLCGIGAHDHAATPAGVAGPTSAVPAAGVQTSAPACVRDGSGITCTEEIAVTAPRRTARPVLVADRGAEAERRRAR